MKNNLLSICLLLAVLLLPSCVPKEEETPIANSQWIEFCEGFDGGKVDVKINGKNWVSNCVQAVYSNYEYGGDETKLLYLYAYNYGSTFQAYSDIEVLVLVYSESTVDGVLEIETAAVFYDGFYDGLGADEWEGKTYASEDASANQMTVTQWATDLAKGNVNMTLVNEEDEGDVVSLNGVFEAKLVE